MAQTGNPFGDFTHQLVSGEMPKHTHRGWVIPKNGNWKGGGSWSGDSQTSGVGFTEEAGGDLPHNNVQPSIIVNMWNRIA
jgi:microcystin-dependent protein